MTATPSKRLLESYKLNSGLFSQKRGGRPAKLTIVTSSSSEDEEPTISIPAVTPTKHRSCKAELLAVKSVTPPKQRKLIQETLETPSSLLSKLDLSSPLKSKGFEPKTLFNNHYQSARKALHSTVPSQMPGREKELKELRNFIDECRTKKSTASLYISGPPGTGKTAALSLILQEQNVAEYKKIFINCTGVKSSRAIYARISTELNLKTNGSSGKDQLVAIENYLKKNRKIIILVLDEIDQLDSKDQSVLYTIFEWPGKTNGNLILIGIANALDLTDRILPRLQARCELKPRLMHFAPYSKQQITEIIKDRLKENVVFSPVAIQMLSGKVAAVSGDVRRALDISRRVLELAEQSENKGVLQSVENLGQKNDKKESVDLKQVISVLNSVYGTSQNLNDDVDDEFPLQQKFILCSLLLILKKGRNKDVTVGKLHDVYIKICRKQNVSAVDQGEFLGVCSLIETRGILRVVGKKEARLNKVILVWDEDEVVDALKDKQLMSSILQDDKCLGKL